MGARLLPLTMTELFAHARGIEREAAERFDELARCMRDTGMDYLAEEFERIGKEEREQFELLDSDVTREERPASWEYAWHYMGPTVEPLPSRTPRSTHEAIGMALSVEKRAEAFYNDVAENAVDRSVSAFAAEMAIDERRHIDRLERLLEREPLPQHDYDAPEARRLAS